MARKLYIFNPTGRQRTNWNLNSPVKVLGTFTSNYTYLGDHYARLLGVESRFDNRIKAWALDAPVPNKPAKGGASRLDRSFRGWG